MKIRDGYEYGMGNPKSSYYEDWHMKPRLPRDPFFWMFIIASLAIFIITIHIIYTK